MWAVVLQLSCPPPVLILVTDGDIRSFTAVERFSSFVAGVLVLRPVSCASYVIVILPWQQRSIIGAGLWLSASDA